MDPKHSHGPDRVDYQETPGDLTEVHSAIQREHPEPTAESTPVPMWLIITCGVAVCWAGLYLGFFNGGLKGDVFNELTTTASFLFPAPVKVGSAPTIVVDDPILMGKSVYATCQACHRDNGTGQAGAIPPLAKSPFVTGSEKRLASIILKGLKGPITVNGASYNSQMQAWEGSFNNKKLAAVATYIRASFGNNAGPITEAQIAAARKELADHKEQFTEPEVLQIPEDATLPGAEAPGNGASGGAPTPNAAGASPTPGAPTANPSPGAPAATPAASGTAPATPSTLPTVTPGSPAIPPATPPAATPPAATPPATPPNASTPPATPPASVEGAATPEQLAAGKAVYMTTCFACHQITGAGIPMVFPPLTKSPYVGGPADRLVAMILKGNLPPMTVDGKVYAASPMPPQETLLDDAKVAAVATYVRASFGNAAPPVTTEQAAAVRAKFVDRKTSWMQAELDAWKE